MAIEILPAVQADLANVMRLIGALPIVLMSLQQVFNFITQMDEEKLEETKRSREELSALVEAKKEEKKRLKAAIEAAQQDERVADIEARAVERQRDGGA